MMKKVLLFAMALCVAMVLVGCGTPAAPAEPLVTVEFTCGHDRVEVAMTEDGAYCDLASLCTLVEYEFAENAVTASPIEYRENTYTHCTAVELTEGEAGEGQLQCRMVNGQPFVKAEDFDAVFENIHYEAEEKKFYKDFIPNLEGMLKKMHVLKIPIALGWPEHTEEEILAMDGLTLEETAAKINTLYDYIQYIRLMEYQGTVRDIHFAHNGYDCSVSYAPSRSFAVRDIDCGSGSNLLNYMLGDDYDEFGYLGWADVFLEGEQVTDGGGHIFNYIRQGDMYYTADTTCYIPVFSLMPIASNDDVKGIHYNLMLDDLAQIKPYVLDKTVSQPKRTFYSIVSYPATGNRLPVFMSAPDGRFVHLYSTEYENKVNLIYYDSKFLYDHPSIFHPTDTIFVDIEPPTEADYPAEVFNP